MSRDRLLVIDADLPKRLASMLVKRRRNAVSAAELGLAHDVKDFQLLRAVAARYPDSGQWVIVTGDDGMPAEHGGVVLETEATIATVHPEYPAEMTQHEWRIDVVQRWAHAMQSQKPQTVRRYALNGSHVWTPRRRHTREIALHGWTPWRQDAIPGVADDELGHIVGPEPEPERLPGFD